MAAGYRVHSDTKQLRFEAESDTRARIIAARWFRLTERKLWQPQQVSLYRRPILWEGEALVHYGQESRIDSWAPEANGEILRRYRDQVARARTIL